VTWWAFANGTCMIEQDLRHIRRAIELAERGRGHTSPNPLVGAVIVRDGEVLGEGFHTAYGASHAEVAALESCRIDPVGATIYVTLEPCCHQGQTPPCTDAILKAGIKRVVVASDDPTDKASGRGLGILRDEGVEVVTVDGECAQSARLLNQPFRKHALTGRPYVTFKSAMSLDGKVATQTGDSRWISGEESRRLVHRWRAQFDAVAIGLGTALADNPLLTARTGEETRQPRRVVFDSEGRLPLDSVLARSAHDVSLVVVISRACARAAADSLRAAGAEIVTAAGGTEQDRVSDALQKLGDRGIQSMLLEGGPHLAGAFLDAGEVDEMRIFVAPIAVGGRSARAPLEGEGSDSIEHAQKAASFTSRRVGEDLLIEARLKEW
jgi:diaminohydroxyphosphoribosylaminopyrimidine deaminase/5-amino-6-(5-phosphoribosylamino)uracil reductase